MAFSSPLGHYTPMGARSPDRNELLENVVNTGRDGQLDEMTPTDLHRILNAAVSEDRIVLHFHGGLVSQSRGLQLASRLKTTYKSAGAFPVFFVWQSGIVEVLKHNVLEIAREELFERMLRRVLAWSVGKVRGTDEARGGVALPPRRELDEELAARHRFDDPDAGSEPFRDDDPAAVSPLTEAEEKAFLLGARNDRDMERVLLGAMASRRMPVEQGSRAGIPSVTPIQTRIDQHVLDELVGESEGARGEPISVSLAIKLLKVLRAVLRRYAEGTDSGVYPTVMEELLRAFYIAGVGGATWAAMKKETLDTFDEQPLRGGRLVLDTLYDLLPHDRPTDITLVGHSTGAVFIDNFLTEIARRKRENDQVLPESVRLQVALLAPAATTAHFATAMDSGKSMVQRTRVFTMKDDFEQADRLLGAVYPRSLLYLVSGILERDGDRSAVTPLLGLARYLGQEANDERTKRVNNSPTGTASRIRDVQGWFGPQNTLVLSPTGPAAPEGFRAGAVRHDHFDQDPLVLESLVHMIADWSR